MSMSPINAIHLLFLPLYYLVKLFFLFHLYLVCLCMVTVVINTMTKGNLGESFDVIFQVTIRMQLPRPSDTNCQLI